MTGKWGGGWEGTGHTPSVYGPPSLRLPFFSFDGYSLTSLLYPDYPSYYGPPFRYTVNENLVTFILHNTLTMRYLILEELHHRTPRPVNRIDP